MKGKGRICCAEAAEQLAEIHRKARISAETKTDRLIVMIGGMGRELGNALDDLERKAAAENERGV